MKKTINKFVVFLITFSLLASACTDSDVRDPDYFKPINTHYVPYEDALQKALSILSASQPQTRAKALRVKAHQEFSAGRDLAVLTRSIDAYSDSIDVRFHVINFEDNAGYALVSADDRTSPIYAYSTEGNMNLEKGIEETGLSVFMKGAIAHYIHEVEMASVGGPFPYNPDPIGNDSMLLYPITYFNGQYCYTRYTENTQRVPALTSTAWDQCSPYNFCCPNIDNQNPGYEGRAATGCVTIAIAQIMAYHRFPLLWDWDSILSSPSYYTHNNISDSILAPYILDIANSADVSWGPSSPSNISKARNAFISWGYSLSTAQDFNRTNVINSLLENLPVYCQGSGHAWVIDGYSHTSLIATYYELDPPHNQVGQETSSGNTFYHCNWGWGEGGGNGYYLDTFEHSDNVNLNENNKILHSIQPNV